ncbi:MAG: hypothetical protein ACF8PN_07705 [Phycisphaerales bacterium]
MDDTATPAATVGGLFDSLANLPIDLQVGIMALFVSGVVVWALGRKLLRPMLTLAAAGVGAMLGFVGGAFVTEDLSIWWSIAIGAVLFALFAIALYRVFMAALLAATLAIAAPLGFFTYAEITDKYANEPSPAVTEDELILPLPRGDESEGEAAAGEDGRPENLGEVAEDVQRRIDDWSDRVLDAEADTEGILNGETEEQAEWRRRFRNASRFVAESLARQWRDFPSSQKLATIFASFLGVLIGVVGGALTPNLAAIVVTALSGSFLFLTTGYTLAQFAGLPIESIRPDSATGVLGVWLIVSVIGAAIQLRLSRKKADKE